MSADNYFIIRKDSGGQFVPVMGFASATDFDDFDDGYPQIDFDDQPRFDTVRQTLVWASEQNAEYGVSIHPECEPTA